MAYTISQRLNIRPKYFAPVVVHVSAGDENIPITFQLYDGAEPYTIPSGSVISVQGTRKDGASWITTGTASGNEITFTSPSAMAAVEGAGIAEVSITSGSETYGSANFLVLVERASIPNGVSYSNDPSVFQDILNYLKNGIAVGMAEATSGAVAEWLEENITPTTPAVDASLSVAGAAADAAATGALKSDLSGIIYDKSFRLNNFSLGTLDGNGQPQASTNRYITDYIGNAILDLKITSGTVYICCYDENKNYLDTVSYTTDTKIYCLVSSNVKYCRFDIGATSLPYVEVTVIPKLVIDTKYEEIMWTVGSIGSNGENLDDSQYNYRRRSQYFENSFTLKNPNAATVEVYYYRNDYSFISVRTITTEETINIGDVTYARYVRICCNSNKSYTVCAVNVEPTGKLISVNISEHYEHGELNTTNGRILYYPTHERMLANKRTDKMLAVSCGSTLTATYADGELYVLEYNKEKTFVRTGRLYTQTPFNLTSNTAYVKFEHDNYLPFSVVSVDIKCQKEEWVFNNRYTDETIAFGYKVRKSYGTDISDTDLTYNEDEVFTAGLLRLPPNYSDEGKAVPIIYFAHGSGAFNNIADTEFASNSTTLRNIQYLCDEGFAVFDCFGLTDLYAPKGTTGDPMANPTCMAAIRQGIEWVCNSFNVSINDVYVTGKSLGGIPCLAMAYEKGVNVKAVCALAPEIDACSVGFGYGIASRKGYADDLGFTPHNSSVLDEEGIKVMSQFSDAFKAYARSNATKLLGYNPMYKGVIGLDPVEFIDYVITANQGYGEHQELPNKLKTMQRICATPTKIIIAVDDPAVSYTIASAYIQSLKNGGSIGELRSLPANCGGHFAVDRAEEAPKIESITTECGIEYTDIPLAYAEMVQFFKRFR